MAMRGCAVAAALLGALAAPAAEAGTADMGGSPATGRAFALEVCTPCHVVAPGQRSPARFAVGPAFRDIANSKGMTASALKVFLGSPHPTMPNLILTPAEQRNVIAYILSLRAER